MTRLALRRLDDESLAPQPDPLLTVEVGAVGPVNDRCFIVLDPCTIDTAHVGTTCGVIDILVDPPVRLIPGWYAWGDAS